MLAVLVLAGVALSQDSTDPPKFQKEAEVPYNCTRFERARDGDRVIMSYVGLLGDGTTFDRGQVEFVLGEHKVIKGWELGVTDACAGEKITMIVPPEYGYGDSPADKIPAGSTLYFLTEINGIIRVTKAPSGGDCNEGQKARPNIDVTIELTAKVSKPDGNGEKFLNKKGRDALEIRFGNPDAIRFVKGLEAGLTGACPEEIRTLFLGPQLAYGDQGKKDGSVKPGESIVVEAEITRVRDRKPEDSGLVLGFLETIANGELSGFSG